MAAANAEQGLGYAMNMDPDLVILDIRMPGVDGIELMQRIMDHDNTVPIIINTAYSGYRDNYLTWAADAFITKTSDVSRLVNAARELT